MTHVLVTGASGFIGATLCRELIQNGYSVTGVLRRVRNKAPLVTYIETDLVDRNCFAHGFPVVDCIVHLAGRAHVAGESTVDSFSEFRDVNRDATLRLASRALDAGVKRFVFISSIGVNGAVTYDLPFTESSLPEPHSDYARSKYEAEMALQAVARGSGMELVIIRPPLVYGPDAPGNFGSLVRWVKKGFPLPLGAIHNKRSLVGVDNLVDLIIRCIDHPAAANQVFLAGDGEDLSTTELLRGVGKAMGKPARLIPVPAGLLQFGATLLGKKAMAQRLLGSLQVDISKTCELLDWKPPYTVEEGLSRCFERSN